MANINFDDLKKQGKTVIYRESKSKLSERDWDFWGERKTEDEHVFVYRKIVTIAESERYELEQLLN